MNKKRPPKAVNDIRSSSRWRDGYRSGIRAAAAFAGEWDRQIAGTPYRFEDIILGKFNLIGNKKLRPKWNRKGEYYIKILRSPKRAARIRKTGGRDGK